MNRHNSSIEIVADGLHMPECPRWHNEHLWFSDIRGDTVHRVDDGHVSVADIPAGAAGRLDKIVLSDVT